MTDDGTLFGLANSVEGNAASHMSSQEHFSLPPTGVEQGDLTALWDDIPGLTCCHCHLQISEGDVLARTFTIASKRGAGPALAQKIDVPALDEKILVFHRHLDCLFSSTTYISVSHVWHPEVSDVQFHRVYRPDHHLYKIITEAPVHVLRGLEEAVSEHFEVWHDYVSVPQWMAKHKSKIIANIPRIYSQARMVVAMLEDVSIESFQAMRLGNDYADRARAHAEICSAAWFSRVWTAMEFTQSRSLRAMVASYVLVEQPQPEVCFVDEISQASLVEIRRLGDEGQLGAAVPAGKLFPWQLGPLPATRNGLLRGARPPFAIAPCLLARRHLTLANDLFDAMVGMLNQHSDVPLKGDIPERMCQLAKRCMMTGDLSPVFMIPISLRTMVNHFYYHGHLHRRAFGLPIFQHPPLYPRVVAVEGKNSMRFQAEHLGIVQFALPKSNITDLTEQNARLNSLCKAALLTNGFDLDEFVIAACVRLYGQSHELVTERLLKGNRRERIQRRLHNLAADVLEDETQLSMSWGALLGLSDMSLGGQGQQPPLVFMGYHGNTIHLGTHGNAVVGVKCPGCLRTPLIRVAQMSNPDDILGAVAWRVPGMKYHFTHRGGMGFLLKDHRIVGRFLWGAPTCDCDKLGDVEVELDFSKFDPPRSSIPGLQ